MSKRSRYEGLMMLGCECISSGPEGYFFELIRPYSVSFSHSSVVFECEECGAEVALFYRKPEIEHNPVRLSVADKRAVIGKHVSVPRIVAWVGYAKNTKTVRISMEEEDERMETVLSGALAAVEISATRQQVEQFIQGFTTPRQVIWSLRRQARYQILGEAFAINPSPRGLWFQDRPFEGVVQEIVTCKTGERSPGCQDTYGNWDPPYLDRPETHRLYGCVDDKGYLALVWPGDVKENNGD